VSVTEQGKEAAGAGSGSSVAGACAPTSPGRVCVRRPRQVGARVREREREPGRGCGGQQPAGLGGGGARCPGRRAWFVDGGWPVGRALSGCRFHEVESPLVWEFELFLGVLKKFDISGVARWLFRDGLRIGRRVMRKIVYRLFCIFIISITISSIMVIISSISFIAVLNCLYLSPGVFPFVRFCSPSRWGEVSERLPGA